MNYTVIGDVKLIQVHEGYSSHKQLRDLMKDHKGFKIGFGQVWDTEEEAEEKKANRVGFVQNIATGAPFVEMTPIEEEYEDGRD